MRARCCAAVAVAQQRRCCNSGHRCACLLGPCSDFLREDGLKDKLLDSELVPVQKAVFQLAKSGARGRGAGNEGSRCTPLLYVAKCQTSLDQYVPAAECEVCSLTR